MIRRKWKKKTSEELQKELDAYYEQLKNEENFVDDLEDLDNTVVLTDEQGNDVRLEYLDTIEFKGDEYDILLPENGSAFSTMVLKHEGTDEDGTEHYASIDNKILMMRILQKFRVKFVKEMFKILFHID